MDGVSFLSSPTSSLDSEVENVLSEILDVAAVEQIQRLPSPYDSASSVLPSQIETRFQRLKSLNQTTKTTQSPPLPPPPPPTPPNSSQADTPQEPQTGDALPAFDSPKSLPPKEFDHSWGSPSSSGSSSPPQKQGCCFWASPRKSLRKKGRNESHDDGGWLKDDEMLSDLRTFSVRSQREGMKAALKEQEKVSKEAEKVIKWVKQASARMSVDDLDHDLRP